jgi:hypothetical protein
MNIISIGTFCISAEMIQRAGLRHESHPFDWLFCSVAATIDIIESDFAHFLDPTYLTPLPDLDGHRRCMHSLYDGNNPDRPLFAHRVPTLPEDRAYYESCIARFRSACKTGATLLLFETYGEIEREFERLCAVADKRWPTCSIRAARYGHGEFAIERTKVLGKHELWRLDASPVIGGVRLERPEDEVALMEALCPSTAMAAP